MRSVLYYLLSAVVLPVSLLAQDSSGRQIPATQYPFVRTSLNVITNTASLDPLFVKLHQLQSTNTGVVRIVHIGDSHIQADMMTGPVRRQLQMLFGNAGRGLIFPYSIAKSNPPADVKSSSNKVWQANRLARQEIPVACGVSGFGIHNSSPEAYADVSLAGDNAVNNSFNLVTVFGDSKDADSICYTVSAGGQVAAQWMKPSNQTGALVYPLTVPATGIRIAPCSGTGSGNFSLYGVSLEKAATPGLIYHVIGVNGATFEEYNHTPLFWRGLPQLGADCYILSMGTNEAQALALNRDSFIAGVRTMLQKLRTASPNAVIIITSPAGSYTHSGTPNQVLGDVRNALAELSVQENIAFWDLYSATGGYLGAKSWKSYELMAKDAIHYNKAGYELQGSLLLSALQAAYSAAPSNKRK